MIAGNVVLNDGHDDDDDFGGSGGAMSRVGRGANGHGGFRVEWW